MDPRLKTEIMDSVQIVLNRVHRSHSDQKKRIKIHNSHLMFACPYCGDSHDNENKKRGWLYFDTAYYHCFNCGTHRTVSKFLDEHDSNHLNFDDRITLNQIYRDYQKKIAQRADIDLEVFENVEEYAIPTQELFHKLNLRWINPSDKMWQYCQDRLITHRSNVLAVDKWQNKLYIFNMISPEFVLSYQTRFLTGEVKYKTYTLHTIKKLFFGQSIEPNTMGDKISWTSQVFGFYMADFSKPFTIFEGPIDSFFMRNSIAMTGASKDTRMFDEFPTVRYFFDNDEEGKKRAIKKVSQNKSCFLWAKFIRDNDLSEVKLKDLNDIFTYSKKVGRAYYKDLDKYFSTNNLDLVYL